jgi:hypothetical protein
LLRSFGGPGFVGTRWRRGRNRFINLVFVCIHSPLKFADLECLKNCSTG